MIITIIIIIIIIILSIIIDKLLLINVGTINVVGNILILVISHVCFKQLQE
jgi:hypothetical protein